MISNNKKLNLTEAKNLIKAVRSQGGTVRRGLVCGVVVKDFRGFESFLSIKSNLQLRGLL